MITNEIIGHYIEQYFDFLIKVEAYGVKEYAKILKQSDADLYNRIHDTEEFIVRRLKYDYLNINVGNIIQCFSKECKCGAEEFKDGLNEYIEMQDKSLWEALSFINTPSAEELINYILEKKRYALVSKSNKNINNMQATFGKIYFSAVKNAWKEKWEGMSMFRAKLYDVHNKLVEVSHFSSKDSAIEFAVRSTKKNPDRYNRYVICLRSPINSNRDVIYDIKGGFTFEHVCTNEKYPKEWKADFYDGSDNVILSYTSKDYIDSHILYCGMKDCNAMYGVISYRKSLEEDFFVQYFKTYKCYQNQDVAAAIEEHIIKPNSMNVYDDDFPVDLYRSEEWKVEFYDKMGHEKMSFQSSEMFDVTHLYTNMTSNGFAEYILFHRNSSGEDFTPVYKSVNKDLL